MMKILALLIIFLSIDLQAQLEVSGTVLDSKGEPIIGANVFLNGSYDGGFTDELGKFFFSTELKAEQILIVRYLGFEEVRLKQAVSTMQQLTIRLRPSVNTFDAVEVTGSTFSAGDQRKSTVLKPLDIVTTAGALGDVHGALKTLPGTQANAEDGRLFVRGGDANETAIYVDGMKVFTPYTRGVSGIPVRGRFSPFLFQGVQFSTGGYGLAYGQALSGVLDMKTIDEVDGDETNISLMTLGAGVGYTKKWDKRSLSLNSAYINFTPYTWLDEGRTPFTRPFEGISGEAVYRQKLKKGRWKTYAAADFGGFGIEQRNLLNGTLEDVQIDNNNYYFNSTFTSFLTTKTSIFTGISAGYNDDALSIANQNIQTELFGGQYRLAFKTVLSERMTLDYGAEHLMERHTFALQSNTNPTFENAFNMNISAAFTEGQYHFSKKLAAKSGLRFEYLHSLQRLLILPRLSVAHKVGKQAQVTLSYGMYAQNALPEYVHAQSALQNERSEHFLLNFNHRTKKSTLQLEAYYKKYEQLVRYPSRQEIYLASNDGDGYAYGTDFFWRLNNWRENYDCWISYGVLFTERHFRDFPNQASLPFATRHNLSFVNKIWLSKLKSQLSFTYQYASGRPYHNPNEPGFMQFESKSFHNIDVGWAYLINPQKILYFSVTNAPNIQNEMGRRFSSEPNEMGFYPSELIRPNFNQFFFVGFFWTIGHDKHKNMLEQL